MSNTVIISFIGTSNYTPAIYRYKDYVSATREVYIQSFLKTAIPHQQYLIFGTEHAFQKHKHGLIESGFSENHFYHVPEGFSRSELWDIFEQVVSNIPENAEVYFDVTHGYRGQPLVVLPMLNYLKLVKNITVNDVLYAAFDSTKPDKIHEVVSLSIFNALMSWSQAVDAYLTFGSAEQLSEEISELCNRAYSSGSNDSYKPKQLKSAANNLRLTFDNLKLLRTKDFEKSIQATKLKLEASKEDLNQLSTAKPFGVLVDKIIEKLCHLELKENSPRGLLAYYLEHIKLLYQHNQVIAAVTLLNESIITLVCIRLGLDHQSYEDRDKKAKIFLLLAEDKDHPEHELSKLKKSISDIRNSLNHADMGVRRVEFNTAKIKSGLEKAIDKFETAIKDLTPIQLIPGKGLLNFSNHPTSEWSDEQKEKAILKWGEILDIPFPIINPMATSKELNTLVTEHTSQILKHNPAAVHIMGEQTFVYKMVNALQRCQIPCFASTSNRDVSTDKNGATIRRFMFHQFRPYDTH